MQQFKTYILIIITSIILFNPCKGQTYNLIWADEFSASTINVANWNYDIGAGGWGNNELQHYTNLPSNVTIQNDNLLIIAKKEVYQGSNYTSARLKTQGKQSWKYGKLEARIKMPKTQGVWPAFWMLGNSFSTVGWPSCGEIDIMEHININNTIYGTLHWNNNGYSTAGGNTNLTDVSQYHIYTIEWDENNIKWFIDGIQFWSYSITNNTNSTNEFHEPFFIILNMAIGGNWPGNPNASFLRDTLFVDYVRVYESISNPITAAPIPTAQTSNVISMYSNTYNNITVDTWSTSWSSVGSLTNLPISGNDTKKYTNLNYVGIETIGANLINATNMTTFNIDVWTPNATLFRVKLVDFGADGIYGGGNDVEHEIAFTPTQLGWNSYHIPLSSFTNLVTRAHMAQLILSAQPAGSATIYIDNVYYSTDVSSIPLIAAPAPIAPATSVISLFSNTYTNVPVNTWSTVWSNVGAFTNLQIQGNDTKKYSNLTFVGAETIGANVIDATSMNTFNIDIWTPNMTQFKIKLVDFGANGVWNGGGDDVEHELTFTPTLSGWNSFHIPLSNFTGLTTKAHLAQYIFSGSPAGTGNVYIDNVYFSTEAKLSVTCFLQGSYISPISLEPILYNQGVSSNLNYCDKMTIELHNNYAPFATAYSITDTLKTNGVINCSFPISANANSYYVVVKHRNSIETWSSLPISLATTNAYNFTTSSAQAFGSNMIEIEPGKWALYSGDIDQNGSVDNPDYSPWESDANNFASGYLSTDLNGDGNVDNADYTIWESNSINFIGKITP